MSLQNRGCREPLWEFGTKTTKRKGAFHNWLSMSNWLLEQDSDVIMTVQDDSEFHPDSREFLNNILFPKNAGFVNMYTAKHYSETNQIGVVSVKTSSLWGTLAVVWPRDVLQQVVSHPIAKTWQGVSKKQKEPHEIKNVDTLIGKVLNKLKKDMYFINPSPVTHIAERSTIGHGGNKGRRNAHKPARHDVSLNQQVFPRIIPQSLVGTELKKTNACYHLGEVIRFERDFYKGGYAPVFGCAKFGECVLKRIDNSGKQRCVACKQFLPTGNLVRLGTKNEVIDESGKDNDTKNTES
jgi:hypothetical protein